MSRSNGTKAISLIAALLLCMVFTQTAFAVGDDANSRLDDGTAASTIIAAEKTAEAEDSPNDTIIMDDEIAEPTPAFSQVDPSFDTEYILAGNKVTFSVSFFNKGNETVTLTPKLVGMPDSQHNISESWITISPATATVNPGSVQKFEITETVPKDVDSENYQGQIAFTDDLVPNSIDYVNSMKLNIFVQAQPKLEFQTTYISDNVQAGKEYVYRVNVKNVAAKDVTIDPRLTSYNPGSAQAFSDDAIEITAPSTIKAGESVNLTIKVNAPEDATGTYYGNIDMKVNGKTSDGSNSQIGLSFNVWRQPVVPFVKNFSTKTNAQITIEVTSDNYNPDMGLRVSPLPEKPTFELELTRNSKSVKLNSVKSVDSGNVNIGGSSIIPLLGDLDIYQNFNGHYAETYTAPGAAGDWKLTILPKNTNNFGYSITFGDATLKK